MHQLSIHNVTIYTNRKYCGSVGERMTARMRVLIKWQITKVCDVNTRDKLAATCMLHTYILPRGATVSCNGKLNYLPTVAPLRARWCRWEYILTASRTPAIGCNGVYNCHNINHK